MLNQEIEFMHHKSPIGELIVGTFEGQLCLMDYRFRKQRSQIDRRLSKNLNASFTAKKNKIIQQTIVELDAFLTGQLKTFTVPIRPVGTPFQNQVWEQLLQIPYGQTMSYLELTKRLNLSPNDVRAVAGANGANAISVLIPCHRIIGKNGQLVGYAGGLAAKNKLLKLEKNNTLNPNELPLWS